MKTKLTFFSLIFLLTSASSSFSFWGFYAHKKINRLAVFTLPPDIIGFYKNHISYIEENAVNPDKRRYAVANEAARHYIDLDVYGENALEEVPHRWDSAVAKYSEDTLQAYGIVPWYIFSMKNFLTKAFEEKDLGKILRLSADIGHYIADANVPLHTTENYNGQLSGQYGIHGFWESRLPELYADDFDFFVGKAEYIDHVSLYAWEAVAQSHRAVDSVLKIEKELSQSFNTSKKYSFEERGQSTVRVYSKKYSRNYHALLDNMVERQMRKSIKMVGDVWFTAWVDAGQPDLTELSKTSLSEFQKEQLKEEKIKWENRTVISREHN